MLCALIMAGGIGSRFWPLSTVEKPKQFLKLVENDTMLQMTVNRIKREIPIERIFVCSGKRYVNLIRQQIPELPLKNIIVEPEGRNTASCILLSSLVIKRYYKDATMIVLPADHIITDEDKFIDIVEDAEKFLEDNEEAIVTLGMKPNRAEIAYGYIKTGKECVKVKENKFVKVDSFVEKPDKQTAIDYYNSGDYLWNGGIFLWKLNEIIEKYKKLLPSMYEALHNILDVDEEYLQKEINRKYVVTEPISVDYGILEKSDDIYVVPSNIGWDDIGSWEAIERYKTKDEDGNIHMGRIASINSENNLVISTSNEVIIDGLSDIYVIENNGNILIGRKSKVDKIKGFKDII